MQMYLKTVNVLKEHEFLKETNSHFLTLISSTEKPTLKSFSWRIGAVVIKIHGKTGQQSNNVMQGPDWRGMKGMQRFMAASSTGAARNIGNSFAVEKTVRDVGCGRGGCVCGKVRLQITKTLREDLVFLFERRRKRT